MNLTDEEIRIKVAVACGYTDEGPNGPKNKFRFWRPGGYNTNSVQDLPNYPQDLNACAEFEATLTEDEHLPYWLHLVSLCVDAAREQKNFSLIHTFYQITAKPKQRCIAYLKTKGILP